MQTIRTIAKMQKAARQMAGRRDTIALVPTMGFLHEGHQALIRRAKKEADVVIVTIFVNPAQFAPHEDYKKYPRDEKGDIKKIKAAGGDIVFIPKVEEIYSNDFQTYVTVDNLTKTLEGASRPNHFRGVTTIVAKLFNITRPDVVVFGMKDFQQAIVLKQMTKDLGYPIKYIIAPTVRESDGLAMSSRNKYFNAEQRIEARCLFYALRSARELVKSGVTDISEIEKEMREVISSTCSTSEIDYIAFTNFENLEPVHRIQKGTVCSLAVRLHGVRLIDNVRF